MSLEACLILETLRLPDPHGFGILIRSGLVI
jgi:hypothetical protein